jgi:hypothetical protein
VTGTRERRPTGLRLAAAACGLLAMGAVAIVVASGVAARSYLMGQAARQLRAQARQLAAGPLTITSGGINRYVIIPGGTAPRQAVPFGSALDQLIPVVTGTGGAGTGGNQGWAGGSLAVMASMGGTGLDRGFMAEVTSPGGRLVLRGGPGTEPGPALARLPRRPGRPAAVPASRGSGNWLVISTPVRYRALRIAYTYGSAGFTLLVNGPGPEGQPSQPGRLVTALNLAPDEAVIGRIIWASAAAGAVAVLAVAAAGLAMARAAAARARQASADAEAAARRSAQDLAGQLAATCQALLPPLRVISGFAGYHRDRGPGRAGGTDRALGRIGEEVARLEGIVDGLPPPPAQ